MIDWFRHLYPYGNMHEINLDWIIDTIKELVKEMEEFTGYNQITISDPIEWNATTYYKRFTIVLYTDGCSYISKQDVPVGIPPLDGNYWAKVADFNAQLQSYYNEYLDYTTDTTPELFGAVGDGVTDDTTAIQAAIDSGKPVVFKTGKTYLTNKLTVNHDANINLNGAKIIGISDKIFDCQGTEITDVLLSTNYTSNDKFVKLSSTLGLNVGDLLFLHDDSNVFYTAESTDFYASGVVEITGIDPVNGVSIFPTIPFDLNKNTTVGKCYRPVSVKIENAAGFEFIDSYISAIYLTACKNSIIANISDTVHNLNCCIATSLCLNTLIDRCNLATAEPSTPNYIISNGMGSYNTKITNCNILSTWHSFSNNGVYAICNTIVDKCLFKASTANASYRDHGCGMNTTIRDSVLCGAVFSNSAIMDNCRIIERDNGGVGEIIIQISDVIEPEFVFNNVAIEGIYARLNITKVSDVPLGSIDKLVLNNVTSPDADHVLIVGNGITFNRITEDGAYLSVENINSSCTVDNLQIMNATINEFFGLGSSTMNNVLIQNSTIVGHSGTSLNAVCKHFTMDNVFVTAPDVRPSFRLKADVNVLNNVVVDTPTGYQQGKIEVDSGKTLNITNSTFVPGTYASGTVVNAVNCEINGNDEYSELKYCNGDQKIYYVHVLNGTLTTTALN